MLKLYLLDGVIVKNKILLILFQFFLINFLWSQSLDFDKGEDLFSKNKPEEAVSYLESSVVKNENPKAYVYLSIVYFQLGRYEDSLLVCEKGMKTIGTNKKVLSYNAGNSCFALGRFQEAEKWYTLSISADSKFSLPVLNRANSRLKQNKIQDSILDYELYLELNPTDVQYDRIVELIRLLKEELVEEKKREELRAQEEQRQKEEELRIAEELRKQEEALRLERERIAAEEAERRKKLLEDVASSLQNIETENISVGAEGTFDYGYETELE